MEAGCGDIRAEPRHETPACRSLKKILPGLRLDTPADIAHDGSFVWSPSLSWLLAPSVPSTPTQDSLEAGKHSAPGLQKHPNLHKSNKYKGSRLWQSATESGAGQEGGFGKHVGKAFPRYSCYLLRVFYHCVFHPAAVNGCRGQYSIIA